MNSINTLYKHSYNCAKQAVTLGAKAGGIVLLKLSLAKTLSCNGLGGAITGVIAYARPLSIPFSHINNIVKTVIFNLTKSFLPTTNQIAIGSECKFISPHLFECKFDFRTQQAAIREEIIFRAFLQKTIIPYMANKMPASIGSILNHKITRILLSSMIFASAHDHDDLSSVFIGGILYGSIAEATGSIQIPMIAHILNNSLADIAKIRSRLPEIPEDP